MIHKDHFSLFSLFVLIVAAWGGLLYGYHTAVISGVLTSLDKSFHLSVLDEGIIVSIVLLGGLVSALFAGEIADWIGRKSLLIATAIIFCASSLLLGFADSYPLFLTGRLVSGIAIGFASVVSPMYLSEVAPPHYRGRFVSVFQLMIALGVLIAYFINLIADQRFEWQTIFLISLVPSGLQLICIFFIPETPGWLLRHKENKEALSALDHLRDDRDWKHDINKMKQAAQPQKKGSFKDLFQPHIGSVVFIGLFLSLFQQITGINTVMYYTPKIFNMAGSGDNHDALMATLIVGIVNFVSTLISIWLLDKLGRRLLLLCGVLGMVISQILMVLAFSIPSLQPLSLAGVLIFVFFFALSLGPITWVVISEIYPLVVRGKAMSLAIFVNWLSNYAVSFSFLMLLNKLTAAGTFALYGVISFITLLFIYLFIPETKGKSLEDIEAMVRSGSFKPNMH